MNQYFGIEELLTAYRYETQTRSLENPAIVTFDLSIPYQDEGKWNRVRKVSHKVPEFFDNPITYVFIADSTELSVNFSHSQDKVSRLSIGRCELGFMKMLFEPDEHSRCIPFYIMVYDEQLTHPIDANKLRILCDLEAIPVVDFKPRKINFVSY
jgi:hypothetical protein